jgi:MFS family permease
MRIKFTGLWRHPDFLKLWADQTISLVGSRFTFIALPLTAVLILDASPAQMGILGAAQFLPYLIIGLPAGVWVDRLRRRPILIASDIGRGLVLLTIPLAAFFDFLTIGQLLVVAISLGVMNVFANVANRSYLPSLIERQQLVDGNSKLEMSSSVAQVAGPGLAGGLIQLITAPYAILVDVISFFASAIVMSSIRRTEPAPAHGERRNVWREAASGLRFISSNMLLRILTIVLAACGLAGGIMEGTFVLYVTRELELDPIWLGIVFALGAPGIFVGSLLAGRMASRYGSGLTIFAGIATITVGLFLNPLIFGSTFAAVVLLALSRCLFTLGNTLSGINIVSLSQAITPQNMLGRMNASTRVTSVGMMPVGALLGGAVGEALGLRAALTVAGAAGLFACFVVWFSPLRALREAPTQSAPAPAGA